MPNPAASKKRPVPSRTTGTTDSPNPEPGSSSPSDIVRDLTPSEIESLRREFAASAAWMDEMIRTGEIDRL